MSEGLRGHVGWATFSGDPKARPRPIVVCTDNGETLLVFKGTSTLRDRGEIIIEPGTRVAAAWISSGKPITNPTAFAPQLIEVPRTALAQPMGAKLAPMKFRELELASLA